jgi:hypothetical protein
MDNGREDQKPWVKWFWQDYESDTGLRASSLAAQGLWMRMLSIMAKSKSVGMLLDGESKMESKTLAKLVGEEPAVVVALLDELKAHAVYSQTADGVIYNRRMAKDGQLSEIRSSAGRKGGRPKKQNESKRESKTKAASASASASASDLLDRFLNTLAGADKDAWKKAYPACDIDIEIAKAREWVKANPAKGRKSNYRKFINSWLSRSQDGGGTKGLDTGSGFRKSGFRPGDNLPSDDVYKAAYLRSVEKRKAQEGNHEPA